MFILLVGDILFAEPPQLPPDYPKAQYDEAKVPSYDLPNPLIMSNGDKIADTNTWREKRDPKFCDSLKRISMAARWRVGPKNDMESDIATTNSVPADFDWFEYHATEGK
ncbi:MAG: hypothetical protein ABR955_13740 [Verrucomicrobiota bacterium]|jgi:hypothetical protein